MSLRCGLLGRKLGHSYSPQIHALLADYPYELYEREPEELDDFLKNGGWSGINVTIPYKKAVLPYCSELSPLAAELGSVNTVVRRRDGSLYGDNTDAWGFEQMAVRTGVDFQGKKVLVLGSGGASATVQAVLKHMGARVVVISRGGDNNYSNLSRHADARVLVNTTPVGMYPDNGHAPLDISVFPELEAVLDVVYNPARTRLILDAEARGVACESGLYMLVAQAARAAELFSGEKVGMDKLNEVWKTVGARMGNIVLIGMPGCGKSTIGAELARATGREAVDCDDEFLRVAGMEIPEFFSRFGEAAFREKETEILARLGMQSGLIISTGGGCVTREENYPLLHQNGTIFWLRRDLACLPTGGRPLSQRDGVEKLFSERRPLYERFADFEIDNNVSVPQAAEAILDKLRR